MSFTCALMMLLLGSSAVAAFVLQPSHEESDDSVTSAGFHKSCHGLSLESTKSFLLKSLNLQTVPQVPVGLLDSVHEQWKSAFGAQSSQTHGSEAHVVSASEGGSTDLKCCTMTSEVFMKDLGWDNWVIYPLGLTITHCKVCSGAGNTVQCLHGHRQTGQPPCCHPTSQKMVPIVYIDDFGSVVISSVQLAQGCGCAPENSPQPINM